jgi:hypothetical protein
MKKLILMSALACTFAGAQAQDYKGSLEKVMSVFDTTKSQDRRVELSNKLSLIAKKWNDAWVTHYYASFSKAILAYNDNDNSKKDAYLDDAEKELQEAVALLKKNNDETFVLTAMIANARMTVDPMNRWQKYGKLFSENLESAKEVNPDNPRMYYLQGTSKFHTPKPYGGGKKAAMPYFEKAEKLFAKEQGGDVTKPYWGKVENNYYLAQCKVEDKE